jgi:hypothetical protein
MGLSLIERAFELADSGSCENIADLEKKLTRENYDAVLQHLTAPTLRKALASRIRASSSASRRPALDTESSYSPLLG